MRHNHVRYALPHDKAFCNGQWQRYQCDPRKLKSAFVRVTQVYAGSLLGRVGCVSKLRNIVSQSDAYRVQTVIGATTSYSRTYEDSAVELCKR
jgi:hypothetical protein